MRGIIDRFEGAYAICEMENGEFRNILIEKFVGEAHEGDTFVIEGDNISVSKVETKNRKDRVDKLFDELWEK